MEAPCTPTTLLAMPSVYLLYGSAASCSTIDHTHHLTHFRSRETPRHRLNHTQQQPERGSLPAWLPRQRSTARAGALVPAKSISSATFFSRATQRDRLRTRAHSEACALLPGVAWCRRRWYISKLVCDGDSNRIILQAWRGRRPGLPAATAAHADYRRAHGRSNDLYSGGGEFFFAFPMCVLS